MTICDSLWYLVCSKWRVCDNLNRDDRHEIKVLFSSLGLLEGNPHITGGLPSQKANDTMI